MRPYLPRLSHHRHSLVTGVTGRLQHDGSRGVGSRYRTTATAYQQGRYFYVDKLRLYRYDIERQPIYSQTGRAEGT